MNLYNDIDPFVCAWLQELVKCGAIPPGDVLCESIENIKPKDVAHYVQRHWFCGIGGWPMALSLAGWPSDRPIDSGSCPCPSFSCAGKGKGFDDPRGQLWGSWFRLIRELKPSVCVGEQVEAAIRFGWLDRVFDDFEGIGYACAAASIPACAAGAPHRRQRLFFVAHAERTEPGNRDGQEREANIRRNRPAIDGVDGLADSQPSRGRIDEQERRQEGRTTNRRDSEGDATTNTGDESCSATNNTGRLPRGWAPASNQRRPTGGRSPRDSERESCPLADIPRRGQRADGGAQREAGHTDERGMDDAIQPGLEGHAGDGDGRNEPGRLQAGANRHAGSAGASNFWSASRLILCRDGKTRRIPAERSFQSVVARLSGRMVLDGLPSEVIEAAAGFPIARTVPNRAAILRGAGNAIVPAVAAEFIRAVMETTPRPAGEAEDQGEGDAEQSTVPRPGSHADKEVTKKVTP